MDSRTRPPPLARARQVFRSAAPLLQAAGSREHVTWNFLHSLAAALGEVLRSLGLDRLGQLLAGQAVGQRLHVLLTHRIATLKNQPFILGKQLGVGERERGEGDSVAQGRRRLSEEPQSSAPQPSGGLPEYEQIWGCPDASNVKRWGAKGDGQHDDTAALRAADTFLSFLYLPPGTYLLNSSLVLTKPLVAGWNATIWVEQGASLTLLSQPRRWAVWHIAPLFAGPGRVLMALHKAEVYPDWFKGGGESDAVALQRAGESCVVPCTIMLTRKFKLDQRWGLHPKMGAFSSQAGQLWPAGGNDQGVMLAPGSYSLPLIFSGLFSFFEYCVKVPAGVKDAELQIGGLGWCGHGVLLSLGQKPWASIEGLHLSHLSYSKLVQNTVTVVGSSRRQSLVDVVVRGNFVVTGGLRFPESKSASVLFKGVPPKLTRTQVIWQAIDPAHFDTRTQFAVLQSVARGPVEGLTLRVDTWCGGIDSPGRLVDGAFNDLDALITTADSMPAYRMFWIQGINNRLSLGTTSLPWDQHLLTQLPRQLPETFPQLPSPTPDADIAGPVLQWGAPPPLVQPEPSYSPATLAAAVEADGQLSPFWGGGDCMMHTLHGAELRSTASMPVLKNGVESTPAPLYHMALASAPLLEDQGDQVQEPEAVASQVFYALAPIVSSWPPGEEREFYIDAVFAAAAGAERFRCLPTPTANPGIVCSGFENQNWSGIAESKLVTVDQDGLQNGGAANATSTAASSSSPPLQRSSSRNFRVVVKLRNLSNQFIEPQQQLQYISLGLQLGD